MTSSTPKVPPQPSEPVATVALEIDVQTALALSRATTRAVSALSAFGHREMVWALEQEAHIQQMQGGPARRSST